MRNTPKGLNEELMKMRKLMDFDISENSHDVLSENFVKKSLLSEQEDYEACISPKETADNLQVKLNNLLVTKLKEVKEKIPISFRGSFPPGKYNQDSKIILIFPGNEIPLTWDGEGKWKEGGLSGELDTPISLSSLTETMFSDEKMGECYKKLYDNFPVISDQLNSDKLQLLFKDVQFAVLPRDKRDKCNKLKANEVNLHDFTKPFCIKIKRPYKFLIMETEGNIELKQITLDVSNVLPDTWTPPSSCECEDLTTGEMIKYPCDGPLPPECQGDIFTDIELKLDLVDAFDFDKVEDTDGTSLWHENGGEQFEKFIKIYNETKEKYSMVWDQYLEFLKDKGVIIYGYASRDDDPNKNMRGKYKDCNADGQLSSTSEMQPRKLYNQCLSQKRADQVIKDMVAILPELDGVFTGKGMGESCKSGNCWESGEAVNTDLTSEDRRVTGTFPKFKTTIKN
jgi:hypothetical protein